MLAIKRITLWFGLGLVAWIPLWYEHGQAKNINELHLLFDDRILTLNFQAQPELLQRTAKHFVSLGDYKIPISLYEDWILGEEVEFVTETKFITEIDPKALRDFFISTSINREGDLAPVEINLDADNNIVFTGQPYTGFDIDEERLTELINQALQTNAKYVRVPANKLLSPVVVHPELQKRGIKEIIAAGESNFAGSSDARRQNIIVASQVLNGIVVKKGYQFSFNKAIGDITEENGFVKELVIKGNETKKELGGGVCQVSTTVFRAAFGGGLPIRARKNHSYAVPYYKPYGLDATIYKGVVDFRFVNDTTGDILIQSEVVGDNLLFVFYGTNDGRQVSLEGPFISEYAKAPDPLVYETEDLPDGEMEVVSEAHDGFRSEWFRTITWGADDISTDNIISYYKPWPARLLRGTNDDS